MDTRRCTAQRLKLLGIAGFALAVLAGCSGDDGAAGPAGTTAAQTVAASSTTGLSMTVTGVSVSSPPVVNFRVADQYGNAVVGLTRDDLRFTFAKLVPGVYGEPANWQNYLNTTATGATGTATQGTREGGSTGAFAGTLVDNGDGTYKYTFKTDVTNVASPLAVPYNAGLTHRIGIQTRGTLPLANAAYTFRPSDGATTGIYQREIVKTAKCNECHNTLQAHDQRIDTRYCVTCHNPGSSDPDTGNTVDFKVMIHKIHRGEFLPSVVAGGSYRIIGFGGAVHDFSTVVFPQDIRNCTKCHDGSDAATPQGDNWKTQPSKEACGSCHDDVNFATGANHAGGMQTSNSTCYGCHSSGGAAGPVETSHSFPASFKAAADRFKFSIVDATSVTAGSAPTITFRIEKDGAGLANFKSDPAFSSGANSTLNIRLAWNTAEIGNTGAGNYGQPASINLLTDASVAATGTAGTYTVTGTTIPVGTTGTLRVFIDGHPAGDVTTAGTFTDRLQTKSVFKDFGIGGATTTARRVVVDVAKCDGCHDRLSLHGANRNDEPGVCVNCHNPNATDKGRRTGVGVDGKTEESIDFKRMVHAIHAGRKDDPATTAVEGHGFRNRGIVVYGFGGSVNDFSHVRFPGVLNDCVACHTSTSSTSGIGTYELTGTWDPTSTSFASVLGSTISTEALTADATDDLKISPTAAVCSSCHDGTTSQAHMQANGALFSATQAAITAARTGGNGESCALCHGPGRLADVKTAHAIR